MILECLFYCKIQFFPESPVCNAWDSSSLKMLNEKNKEEKRDGRWEREKGRQEEKRERGNVSLKANEIPPGHLEKRMNYY